MTGQGETGIDRTPPGGGGELGPPKYPAPWEDPQQRQAARNARLARAAAGIVDDARAPGGSEIAPPRVVGPDEPTYMDHGDRASGAVDIEDSRQTEASREAERRDWTASMPAVDRWGVMAPFTTPRTVPLPPELESGPIEEGLKMVEAHFGSGELDEGMDLLVALETRHGDARRLRASVMLGNRLIMEKVLPGHSPRGVPQLLVGRLEALATTEGSARGLVAAIDGSLTVSQLREVLPGIGATELISHLASLEQTGLIGWDT